MLDGEWPAGGTVDTGIRVIVYAPNMQANILYPHQTENIGRLGVHRGNGVNEIFHQNSCFLR